MVNRMKAHSSLSIIMRVKDFGESDLLVTFLTPDRGRLKGVAKGARRSKKRFVNCLDIFSLVNLEYGPRRKGDLYFIHSGKLTEAYPDLRKNYSRLSFASYMIELTEILFPWEVPDPGIFEVLKSSLNLLSLGKRPDLLTVVYEAIAMSLGGYGINLEKCGVCGRIYKGQGTAVFRPENGGIACMNCREITARNPRIDPETVSIIRQLQSKSNIDIECICDKEDIISEIKPIMRLHVDYHLGQRLRTSHLLE